VNETIGHHSLDVLTRLMVWLAAGETAALVVITYVEGGTLRAKGSLMAVRADGVCVGYVSNGCVDADVVLQSQYALAETRMRKLVYGEGSPFRDIVLPCGGRIELCIIPNPPYSDIAYLENGLRSRRSVRFSIKDGYLDITGDAVTLKPKLRLRIAGRGAPMFALARQARAIGFDICVQSPDDNGLEFGHYQHLQDPSIPPDVRDDVWTAVVLLFHDHDWEPALLKQALAGPSFYIGALGSRKTHAVRIETLRSMGVTGMERIKGPIGLLPAMRDANLLAVSTIAEIIDAAQAAALL